MCLGFAGVDEIVLRFSRIRTAAGLHLKATASALSEGRMLGWPIVCRTQACGRLHRSKVQARARVELFSTLNLGKRGNVRLALIPGILRREGFDRKMNPDENRL